MKPQTKILLLLTVTSASIFFFKRHQHSIAHHTIGSSNSKELYSHSQGTPNRTDPQEDIPGTRLPHDQQVPSHCASKRLLEAWRSSQQTQDPGRKRIEEILSQSQIPPEVSVEVGNAAWEQQSLKRFASKHPGIGPESVRYASEFLSEHRLGSLIAAGYTNLNSVWSEVLNVEVSFPVQIPSPGRATTDSEPQRTEDCASADRSYVEAGEALEAELPDLYSSCNARLAKLGYSEASRHFYIRRIAEDLRSIWIASGLISSVDTQYIGLVQLPDAIISNEPPTSDGTLILAGWLYRKFAIEYLRLQGGPKDDAFYDEIYSSGIAGFLSPR